MRKVYIVKYYNAVTNKKDKIYDDKVFGSYDKAARYLISIGCVFVKTPDPRYEYWTFPNNSFAPAYTIKEFEVEE